MKGLVHSFQEAALHLRTVQLDEWKLTTRKEQKEVLSAVGTKMRGIREPYQNHALLQSF